MYKRFLLVLLYSVFVWMLPLGLRAADDSTGTDLGEPFIGELVDVNGRNVLVHCVGEGSPTIWLENGWAAMVVTWQPFQDQLAEHTRVCAYDRAGMGWSDPNGSDRTAYNSSAEFAELLDVLGENEPFIILAWSCGAPIAQIYAAQNPDMALGLVLMDACGLNYDRWVMETYPFGTWQSPSEQVSWLETVRGYAESAAAGELSYDSISWWFNATSSELYGDLYYNLILKNPNYWYTYMWETLYGVMGVNSDQVKAVITQTDMPITAIIAADDATADAESQSYAWMFSTAQIANTTYSNNPNVIWAETSEHAIFRAEPDTVINALLDMISEMNDE